LGRVAAALRAYKTRFDQQVGAGSTTSACSHLSFNSTFPSIQFEGGARIWGTVGPVGDGVPQSHRRFTYWGSAAVNPVVTRRLGVPVGGGDKSRPTLRWIFTLLRPCGLLPGSMQGRPRREQPVRPHPPFENTVPPRHSSGNRGYDPFVGNPIGRVITVGIRAKFWVYPEIWCVTVNCAASVMAPRPTEAAQCCGSEDRMKLAGGIQSQRVYIPSSHAVLIQFCRRRQEVEKKMSGWRIKH